MGFERTLDLARIATLPREHVRSYLDCARAALAELNGPTGGGRARRTRPTAHPTASEDSVRASPSTPDAAGNTEGRTERPLPVRERPEVQKKCCGR